MNPTERSVSRYIFARNEAEAEKDRADRAAITEALDRSSGRATRP
jgi:hypothetical protein